MAAMADTPPAAPLLNPGQARHVLAVFQHIDSLLRSAETAARGDGSPFSRLRADLADSESALLRSAIGAARTRMLAALEHLGLKPAPASLSARWDAEVQLGFAEIAVADLAESTLRGYGNVSPEAAAQLADVAEYLRVLLQRGGAVLHEHDAGGLRDRLARLAGPAADVLRGVERLSAEAGISEIRPLLAAALDRAESDTFDVGVFGQVSSGKSSLINALAGTAVLPVGATPMTAVPIRVCQGPESATVVYQDGPAEPLALADIAVVATEEQNADNRRGVLRVDIRAPEVPHGLCLLDTPGVGSLGTAGPAQAFASLPRCDLGLVLVAAGTAISRDDIALVSGLAHAGIDCRVLLSKADLLSVEDRQRAETYVRKALAATSGTEPVPVGIVSTHASLIWTLEELRVGVLGPLVEHRAIARTRALTRRLRSLLTALDRAMAGGQMTPDGLREAAGRRGEALARVRALASELDGSTETILTAAAAAVAGAWDRGESAADEAAAVFAAPAARIIAEARDAVVRAAGRDDAGLSGDAPAPRVPPIFDSQFLSSLPDLGPPGLLGRLRAEAEAARRLARVRPALQAALARFAARVEIWARIEIERDLTGDAIFERPSESFDNPEIARLAARLDAIVV